jgi:enterochelin esterase-like enzyme
LAPGFHYYRVFVDGVEVNDPASETFYGTGKETSGIETPEKAVDFYLPKDVPHGEVRERWYFSKMTQQWRRIFVYTPPSYDTDRDTRYPVLYLQHGAGEDERGKHEYYESPGTAHEWLTWRRCLHEFAPLLFVSTSVVQTPSPIPGGRLPGARSST